MLQDQTKRPDQDFTKFKVGEVLEGETISVIHANSYHFLVYETVSAPYRIWVTTNECLNDWDKDISHLIAATTSLLITEQERKDFAERIAIGKTDAVSGYIQSATFIFNRLHDSIIQYKQLRARILYLKSCLIFVLINLLIVLFGKLFFIKYASLELSSLFFLFKIAAFGSLGGFLSIAIRAKNLDLNIHDKIKEQVIVSGIVRVFIAMFSSVIIFVMIRSGFVMGFLNKPENGNNVFMIYSFAVIAGFSEQLIPNIIRTVERDSIMGEQTKLVTKKTIPPQQNTNKPPSPQSPQNPPTIA